MYKYTISKLLKQDFIKLSIVGHNPYVRLVLDFRSFFLLYKGDLFRSYEQANSCGMTMIHLNRGYKFLIVLI